MKKTGPKGYTNILESVGITRSHWNMWRDCPPQEMEECLVYECARRTEFWPKLIKVVRENGKANDYTPSDSSWARIYELLSFFTQFPHDPWLNIDPAERSMCLSSLRNRAHVWNAVEAADHFIKPEKTDQIGENDGPFWGNGIEILPKYRSRAFNDPGFLHTIRVDWLRDNEEIVKSFDKWVQTHRNRDYGMYGRVGAPQKGSSAFQRWLREIGGWTISRHTNRSLPPELSREASLTEASILNENGVPEKMYSNEKQLRAAESAAAKRIALFEPEYFYLRHKNAGDDPSGYLRTVDGNPTEYTITVKKRRYIKFVRRITRVRHL